MKYLRVRARPPPEQTPQLFRLLAGRASDGVSETRLLDWTPGSGDPVTVLFEVRGDADAVRSELADTPGLVDADVTPITGDRFYLLVQLRPSAVPPMGQVFDTLTRDGLVVAKPVVYRDGRVHADIVGDSAVLQAAVEALPPGIDVDVRAVGEYDTSRRAPASRLSDRQLEAVLTAYELGYYEHPRGATHADVAERMGCAPNTASEHLQKAEAKLVEGALEPDRRTDSR
ncbi:helix-turn-helix domain-containing protein [Halorussus sp. AFM4]|uniref:helix-turn-helix domain-containing protein n=1 Tax=Halorussus sp. AFM4 TaxID=3421651 RepID=UPI003EBE2985